jgi:peptidoglycan/LPS O-acetylase OafA/YrhL
MTETGIEKKSNKTRLSLPKMPALDGVRGVMVIAVTFYHGGFPGAGGFFLSLDGFFVLSGFLITSLLLIDVRKDGNVNFGKFWSRRARRLLPALIVLVVTILIINIVSGIPSSHSQAAQEGLAAMFYYSNWYYIIVHNGYFGSQLSVSPLQHTWSLAIEEQFYLVWPLILSIILWIRRSLWPLLVATVLGALWSAIEMYRIFDHGANINHAYYGTDARAQALLVGCSLAIIVAKWNIGKTNISKWVVATLATLGTATLAVLWLTASGPAPWAFGGGFFATDVSVACIILATVIMPKGIFAKILSWRVFRGAGIISYGWYLWQFPVDQWLTVSNVGVGGYLLFLVRTAVGLALAIASYYIVEQPIRTGRLLRSWRSFVVTPIAVIGVLSFALTVNALTPSTSILSYLPSNLPAVPTSYQLDPLKVMIVGDSDALTLGLGLGSVSNYYGDDIYVDGLLGCGVLSGGLIDDKGNIGPQGGPQSCSYWESDYRYDVNSQNPDVAVLLVGRWECLDHNWGNGWEHIGEPAFDSRLRSSLATAINILHSNGEPVILMTSPYFSQGNQPNGAPWPQGLPSRVNEFNKILRQVASQYPKFVTVFNLNKLADPGGQFAYTINGVQIRNSDGVHFVPQGAVYLSKPIFAAINKVGFKLHRKVQPIQNIIPPIVVEKN